MANGDGADDPRVAQANALRDQARQLLTLAIAAGGAASTGPGRAAGLSGISAHDPGFDQTSFLAWVKHVHFAMVTAYSSGEPQGVRPFVGDVLYPRLSAAITDAGKSPLTDVVDQDGASIQNAHTDASTDTLLVSLASHAGLPSGSSGHAIWTFQRSSQATTPPGGAGSGASSVCPSCGAPLKLDAAGECTYCRAPFKAGSGDWILVEISDVPQAVSTIPTGALVGGGETASGCAGRAVTWIIIGSIIIGVVAAIGGIVAAISSSNSSHSASQQAQSAINSANSEASSLIQQASSQISAAVGSIPTVPVTTPKTTPPTAPAASVTANLTLTGSINLSPSDLDSGDFVLNGHSDGTCLPAGENLHTITFNVTFDSGAALNGQFALASPIGRNGTADLASGGAAILHFTGPTQASADDEKWPMPAGQPGLVTVTTDGSGGGTLKWQSLQSSEPSSNYAGPLSGLVTWTCG